MAGAKWQYVVAEGKAGVVSIELRQNSNQNSSAVCKK